MKRKLWIILALALVLATLCCGTALADQSGKCGDNVTRTLTSSGALTISGTGEMREAVQTRSFQFSELHKGRNAAGLCRIEPTLPALIGSERVTKLEEHAKLLLHRIADRKV